MTKFEYSKIKDIYLELNGFEFYHSPSNPTNKHFIGRQKIKKKLSLILDNPTTTKGAYLVTGYRGMGKTSAVNEALFELKNRTKNNYEIIELSLSQDVVKDVDVLRQIARSLYLKWDSSFSKEFSIEKTKLWNALLNHLVLFLTTFLSLCIITFVFQIFFEHISIPLFEVGIGDLIRIKRLFLLTFFSILLIGLFQLRKFLKKVINTDPFYTAYREILLKLDTLNNRLYAETSKASQLDVGPKKSSSLFSIFYSSRNTQNYSVATSEEIEKELCYILSNMREIRKNHKDKVPEYIIVIDELDKIEPSYFLSPSENENRAMIADISQEFFQASRIRKRQEAVAKLLANLKSFLNSADAKFIFIGGREMFDASLADIADRESFYSSIFNEVIYVNSFFKDKVKDQSGISGLSEAFVCQYLLSEKPIKNGAINHQECTLEKLVNEIESFKIRIWDFENQTARNIEEKEKSKIVFLLQSFIIFLTFRSNGSPKKMIQIFEKYIVKSTNLKNDDINCLFSYFPSNGPLNTSTDIHRKFIRFSFLSQYEIGITSNLYRPYSIIHSRNLKLLGDKLLYSTAFIMDHILKFHNSAFSWRNLELIPDIILINKDPNLRHFIQDIMSFLFKMHIRDTVNALFQYKFYRKITNEIQYLSKISELSSAAFNFTLDESLHLKAYYKRKLSAKYKEYQEFQNATGTEGFIHSIGYLHSVLGDLYYYDQEYDDAIIHYSDSIQILRSQLVSNKELSSHQAVLFMRHKLQLGLCLEKVRAYDSSYSIYRSLILQGPKILRFDKAKLIDRDFQSTPISKEHQDDDWEKPYRRMQLFLRPHIALLDVIEKQRTDGITFGNLERNIKDYCDFLSIAERFPSVRYSTISYGDIGILGKSDKKRIQTLLIDYYNNVGSILFYKNKNFVRLHEIAFESFLLHEIKIPEDEVKYWKNLNGLENKNNGENGVKDKTLRAITSALVELYEEGEYEQFQQGDYAGITTLRIHNLASNLYAFTTSMCSYFSKKGALITDSRLLEQYSPSLTSYIYYRASLREFILPYEENFIQINPFQGKLDLRNVSDFTKTLFFLVEESSIILNSTQFYALGNLLNKLGDSVLAIISRYSIQELPLEILDLFLEKDNAKVLQTSLSFFSNMIEDQRLADNNKSIGIEVKKFFTIDLAFYLYRIAAISYYKSGKAFSRVFQYKKLLYILRDYVECFKREEKIYKISSLIKDPKIAEKIEKIGLEIIASQSEISGVSNRAQILKYKEVLKNQKDKRGLISYIYTSLTTSPEVRETILIIEEIKMKLCRYGLATGNRANIQRLFPKRLLHPMDTVTNMFERLIALRYQCEFEFFEVQNLFYGHLNSKGLKKSKTFTVKNLFLSPQDHTQKDHQKFVEEFIQENAKQLHFHITNAIFCLREAIRILNTFGISYIISYSYLANAHYKFANWCQLYQNYKDYSSNSNIDESLSKLIGESNLSLLNRYYHLDIALNAYNSAISIHTEGAKYRDAIADMHFLDDDFNDNLTHFCAASERFRINIGVIGKKIKYLQELLQNSNLGKYENYVSR